MRLSLLALAALLVACPSMDDDDSATDDDDASPACGSAAGDVPAGTELGYDSGNPLSDVEDQGWSVYGIELAEVPLREGVAFVLEHPAIIRGVRAHLAQLPDGADDVPIRLGIHEDFGANGFDDVWWDDLWTGDLCLGDLDVGWHTWVLDEELRVEAGLVHVAHRREGAGDVAWSLDTSVEQECGPENDCHSSVHLPEHTDGAQYYAWNGLSFPISDHWLVRLIVEYVDVVEEEDRIFQPLPNTHGAIRASFGDYDNDGDDDLLLSGPRLLRNDGGTFVDANGSAGFSDLPDLAGEGGVWGDYDNDGCLDLFVYKGSTHQGDHLLHNECDGTFTDVTVAAGIADGQAYADCSEFNFPTFSATWWDIDADGLLDLYVANRECFADGVYYVDQVWHNEGGGTFTEWTGTNGFLGYTDPGTPSIGTAAADADGDGDVDLYVSNFRLQPNLYFRNDGGTVTQLASAVGVHGEAVEHDGATYYGQSRSATWADIDTDGDFDLIQANLAHQRFFDFSDKTQVFLNDGTGNFGDAQGSWGTPWSNLGIRYIERPWTPVLQDFDSDTALDLAISAARGQPTDFYWGRGEGTYIWDSYAAGIEPHDAAMAAADIDLDGDVDLVTGNRIYANTAAQGAWVSVGVVGNVAANRDAIGATLRAFVGEAELIRVISGGSGQQDSLRQHIGLGEASTVDRFEVDYPGGGTVSFPGPFAAGQRWWLFEDGTTETGWAPPTDRRRVIRKRTAAAAMRAATTYAAWREAAGDWERATGGDTWRSEPASSHYHADLIRDQLDVLRQLRADGDVELLIDHLHESLHRNLGDLESRGLYVKSPLGTKHLIGEYLDEIEDTIETLVNAPIPGFGPREKLRVLTRAIGNFGRTALLLSGGATLGFYHLGVVKALWRAGLLPEVISGASMGAMVAAGICSRTDAELDELFAPDVPDLERVGLRFAPLKTIWTNRAVLDPDVLLATIEHNCGGYTFEEAHDRSGRTLNISVAPTRKRQKPRVLSHLTAPRVFVKSAALASSAVPGMFPPITLTRRGRGGVEEPYIGTERWIDGSFGGDLPMMRIGRLHNVNHFIVSQVNPHVLPFAGENRWSPSGVAMRLATAPLRKQAVPVLNAAKVVTRGTPLRQSLNLLLSLAQQEYGGDIDIHPRFEPGLFLKMMKNPSEADLGRFVLEGQRATWPKLAMIRDHTRIARCLSRCEAQLRAEIEP